MPSEPEHIPDDVRFAELFRAADADLPPPDAAFLAALGQRSLDVFLANSNSPVQELQPESSKGADPAPSLNKNPQPTLPAPAVWNWRQFMLAFAFRSTMAASAALAMFAAWLVSFPGLPVRAGVPFSEVLDELRTAKSLHLELAKEGQATEVWVRAPGLVRLEDSPQRYRIAAGSRLWQIDENANTVSESDSPWFLGPQEPVDLLGLLEVGIRDASALLTARPVERTIHDGKDCFVYRVELPTEEGRVEVEALADAGTNQLVALLARRAGARGAVAAQGPPLAELRLVAVNVAVADEKFAVSKSLTDDGRIGTIRDPQGIVVLRPMLAKRWTPLCRETPLKPGDWLRTELRGANAVKVVLSSDTVLTLGPGSQLECLSPTQARLHTGEVQVTQGAKLIPFELLAPLKAGSRKFVEEGKKLVRVARNEELVDVPQQPQWLAGFEGSSSNESLGSLIVNLPDGRNEPLTVGYHKVSVEIRDQIARTTIEESFVNRTRSRLEGVFHFPLPQDASISGFGMWIGNELVEADVVEKQRAREIYETILREKRDPGLLEWTGGNIFKARVFPIEAQSEKRIKIVYTQFLPLRANRYRYTYGLRSELLRTNPLRELSLSVTVNSALPLKDIACPTHAVRRQLTAHSGQVEFAAQEYTPSRDFEVVCEVDGRQSDVVVIPHRRGDDGYLLVQVTPPGPEGNLIREVVPDGKPLQLVLLCDTSSSMDSEKRQQQADFVTTVLSSLGENDRFSVVAVDVNPVWAASEPLAPTADNVAKAQKFLADRISLGWTNLDRAFSDINNKAPADAQVIYVGDGIVSAGDSDPAAFVNRLGRIVTGAKPGANEPRRGFHAVPVGNSYESVVLKGIAALGGGSVRSITGEQTPQGVALELLNEIAQPGLRDMKVEFKGLKVAAVYPDRLPNLAAGTQQILVGRYLPEGKDQRGEVIVTGKRGTETVRYAAQVNFKDAEEGNSFIPRLWARSHLDYLLQQGTGSAIRDDIIRLSEEFHIITPYTSLLVLESDADRERFGVQRRYEMRDGERFFAEGRSNANFELLQQQMKLAGNWRLGLRRSILRSWAGLGRNSALVRRQLLQSEQLERKLSLSTGRADVWFGTRLGKGLDDFAEPAGATNGAFGPAGSESQFGFGVQDGRDYFEAAPDHPFGGGVGGGMGYDVEEFGLGVGKELSDESGIDDFNGDVDLGVALKAEKADEKLMLGEGDFDEVTAGSKLRKMSKSKDNFDSVAMDDYEDLMAGVEFDRKSADFAPSRRGLNSLGRVTRDRSRGGISPLEPASAAREVFGFRYQRGSSRGYSPDYYAWLDTLFPSLSAAPRKSTEPVLVPEEWSPDALALSRSLSRVESLNKMDGGIELRRTAETFDPRWDRRESRNSDLTLYSPHAWLTRSLNAGGHITVDYCNAKERSVFSLALLLGRVRPSVKEELLAPPLGLYDLSIDPLHVSHRHFMARVEPAGENLAKLIISTKGSTFEQHFTIDTVKHVLIKQETFDAGMVTGTTVYSDFVEVSGTWWAKKSLTTDAKGRQIGLNTYEIVALPPDQYQQRLNAELAPSAKVQFIRLPSVSLKVARQKVVDGSAGFDERLLLILHAAGRQQWEDLFKQVDEIEKLAADKPGVRWMRPLIQVTVRRNNEARLWFLDEARRLVANKTNEDLYLAEFILGQAYGITSWPEYLEIVQVLKPVYHRQPEALNGQAKWQEKLISCYESLGRVEEALALKKGLAQQAPWNLYAQIDYAQRLRNAGHSAEAIAWLQRELDRKIERTESELESLDTTFAMFYRVESKWKELLNYTSRWIQRRPTSRTGYAEHLSALIFNNQLGGADALVNKWLLESQVDGKLSPEGSARLDAAVNFALGSISHVSTQRIQERWIEPLAKVARFFAQHPSHFDVTERVMANHYFAQSDECDRLRGEFLATLQGDLMKLTAPQLSSVVRWTISGRVELPQPVNGRKQLDASEIDVEIWKKISRAIQARWAQAQDKLEKHTLSEILVVIYGARFRDVEYLPFLRERISNAPAEYKAAYITALYDALLSAPWTNEIEQEVFARLRQLTDEKEPVDQLPTLIPALHQLVDRLIAGRMAAATTQLQDQGDTNKLTRQELGKKRADIKATAQNGMATRLAAEAAKEQHASFAAWIRMEQAWLDVKLNQRLPEIEAECWKIVGAVPPKAPVDDDADEPAGPQPTPAELKQGYFDALLRQRAFTTILHLTVRRGAAPASVEKLVKFIDTGIGYGGNDAATWRTVKFQVLVALDRPDELERELRDWTRVDVSTAPWRMLLARLLAERGQIADAVPLFEAAEKDKLLSGADYRLLADWYLALNRRDAYERARIESFKQTPENQLNNLMYQIRNRWQQTNRPLPSELDEDTLFAWKALFEKTSQPENYLWHLRDLYTACRDFRLLQMLPDAALGRTPQQAYAFIISVQSQVLYELRNEATADEIIARIKKLREGERTPTDLRALDLMEAVIERKSSEILNQPGPHVDACLAALKRAFARKWADGEPVQMANFLKNLGTLHHSRLVEEHLRELRELQQSVPAGTREHLQITNDYCHVLFWDYHRQDEALQEMSAVVAAYDQNFKGQWPHADDQILGNFIHLYEGAKRHAAGEVVLRRYMAKPENPEQESWLRDRLVLLFNSALQDDGTVSLGTGKELFNNLIELILKDIQLAETEHARYTAVVRIENTFRLGHQKRIDSVSTAVTKFAFELMPQILQRQQSQYQNTVANPIGIIHDVLGPHAALKYLVERMEQFPDWMDLSWNNSWQVLGRELGRQRQEAAQAGMDIKELEPRVLKLVLNELRRELITGDSRDRNMYHVHYSYYWGEKAGDFARVANEVFAEHKTSGRRAVTNAHYFWEGLANHPRAIEILLLVHKEGLLDVSAQAELVGWLQTDGRFAETIPLLETLVKQYPDAMHYRTQLMNAYHRSQRPEQLRELTAQTSKYFHEGGRWQESNISAFARACRECGVSEPQNGMTELAVKLLDEVIALHQRNRPGNGLGDSELSALYQELARAHSTLGHTKEAVEAASAAIVCWPARHERRVDVMNTLLQVLGAAKDLDAFVKHLDQEAGQTGKDSPILRKAIGQTYQSHHLWDQAIAQLQLAVALQPNDRTTHKALIECYDAADPAKYKGAAVKQLLTLIDLDRHDLTLYQQLAERMKNDEAEAERAATSIIESAPNESENHTALAEWRQKQERWDEAIPHWEQVAKLRRLEPTGLLQLARAQLHQKQWDVAKKSIETLRKTEWPARFNNVRQETQQLEVQLPKN